MMSIKNLIYIAAIFTMCTVTEAMNTQNHVRFAQSENIPSNIFVGNPQIQKSELLAEYKLIFPNDKEFDKFEIGYDALTELRKSGYKLMYRDKPASVVKFEQAFFGNTLIEKLYRDFCETIKVNPQCASLYIEANYMTFISMAVGHRNLGSTITGLYKASGGEIYRFWHAIAEKTARR